MLEISDNIFLIIKLAMIRNHQNIRKIIQSFFSDCETCFCVSRDPDSKRRLIMSLWTWQHRMGINANASFTHSVESYADPIEFDTFSQIITTCKILESHLLILTRSINMKKGNEIAELMKKILEIIRVLETVSKNAAFVKPRLFLLKAYFNLMRGRKFWVIKNVRAARKYARQHSNKMDHAWIIQNERTWSAVDYNNMAQYWVEHVAYGNGVDWQEVYALNLHDWSTMLYPLPIPDSFI